MKSIVGNIILSVEDVFGNHVRTTDVYWQKIIKEKHKELSVDLNLIKKALQKPGEVRKSVSDPYINLFYLKINRHYLVVVVKYLQDYGFIVTVYETSKLKRKGTKLWPK